MDGWKDIESSRINDEYFFLLHSCRPKTEKNRNAAAIGIVALLLLLLIWAAAISSAALLAALCCISICLYTICCQQDCYSSFPAVVVEPGVQWPLISLLIACARRALAQ